MSSPAPDDADLSVARLVEEVAAKAGPWSGDAPFTATLALLVESTLRTGAPHETGRQVLRRSALRHLRNLRDLRAYVDDRPDIAGAPLEAPIVVTGLPRTGTTLLHHLLALDPAHRILRFWEALRPVPPDAGGPSVEARQVQAGRWLDSFYRLVPGFEAIHRATPTGPEECDALLQNTFASQHFDDMFDAEEYSTWLATASMREEYEHYALQLRVLSGPDGARWALKSPSHLGHLDALLGALPNATIVFCHREPQAAVGSYASLIHTLRRAYSDTVSPKAVGRQALNRAASAMQRALDVRDGVAGSSFVDVSYPDLLRRPVETVRTVYRHCDRPLDPDVEGRMRRWVAANRQHRHGVHEYGLARFGLTGEEVDATLAFYTRRFGALAGA